MRLGNRHRPCGSIQRAHSAYFNLFRGKEPPRSFPFLLGTRYFAIDVPQCPFIGFSSSFEAVVSIRPARPPHVSRFQEQQSLAYFSQSSGRRGPSHLSRLSNTGPCANPPSDPGKSRQRLTCGRDSDHACANECSPQFARWLLFTS
jgi:hypothetical protein